MSESYRFQIGKDFLQSSTSLQANYLDPQVRKLLEVTLEAIVDAGKYLITVKIF